jgi:uncharacterized protein (TIGR03118 family)
MRRFRARITALFAVLSAGCLIAIPADAAIPGGPQVTAKGSLSSWGPAQGESPEHRHGVTETDLVSDIPGRAQVTDPNLVNSWGMSSAPGGPVWVSDNGTNKATVYTGARPGQPVQIVSTVVNIPGHGAPTGQVFNPTDDFKISASGKDRPATYIFAGEEGDISGWNPEVSPNDAILKASTPNAVYKGVALIRGALAQPQLLAANFRAGRIDVFDDQFRLQPPSDKFQDPTIPAGFAPFNVAEIDGTVLVTYAKQDAAKHDDVAGPGNGFINQFDRDGRLLRRLVSNGPLNSPWGMVLAPPGFGKLSGDLLVGNFGDGRINVFDRTTGRFEGPLSNPDGTPIVIDGLWGLMRGTTTAGGRDALWFAAGIQNEQHGLLGVLRPARDEN